MSRAKFILFAAKRLAVFTGFGITSAILVTTNNITWGLFVFFLGFLAVNIMAYHDARL